MVGGAAYYAGKKSQASSDRESDQEYRLQELEAQQGQAAAAPPPASSSAPAGPTPDTLEQLQKLGQLREQGVLTDEEFDIQKRRLLGMS
jgi:hypothetical protein